MKNVVLTLLLLVFVAASPASAQRPGSIGLYTDETRTQSCITGVGFYPAQMWVWCLPGENGQICAEFGVVHPPNVIESTIYKNGPIISVDMGDITGGGWSVCFSGCHYEWLWLAWQQIYITDPTPGWTEIIKHSDPDIACVQAANCLPGYPLECMTVLTKYGVNQECPPENPIGVEETNWGAIKSLYR